MKAFKHFKMANLEIELFDEETRNNIAPTAFLSSASEETILATVKIASYNTPLFLCEKLIF